MLFTAITEVVELQTSRLPDAARRDREMPMREALSELAAGLRVTERTVQRRMSDATTLLMRFTRTCAALSEGRISPAHATVILEAGSEIDDDDARAAFEMSALDVAEIETVGRLRSVVRSIAEQVQPVDIAGRHREARKARGVFVRDLPDHMAELITIQPGVIVHGILDRLTQMAREDRHSSESADVSAEDERTMDQRRADILADLLLAGAPAALGDGLGAITAHVQVTVPVLTLAGVHETGATLAGYGPIDPETARCLAADAPGWDRVMTHPVTGAVLAVDRYRPSADLLRALRVRDEHCRFPGAASPSGGAMWTIRTTLRSVGRRTSKIWRISAGATIRSNTQRTGRCGSSEAVHSSGPAPPASSYIDVPTPTLRFIPSGDPPPF